MGSFTVMSTRLMILSRTSCGRSWSRSHHSRRGLGVHDVVAHDHVGDLKVEVLHHNAQISPGRRPVVRSRRRNRYSNLAPLRAWGRFCANVALDSPFSRAILLGKVRDVLSDSTAKGFVDPDPRGTREEGLWHPPTTSRFEANSRS
jgi:hypothetical protein